MQQTKAAVAAAHNILTLEINNYLHQLIRGNLLIAREYFNEESPQAKIRTLSMQVVDLQEQLDIQKAKNQKTDMTINRARKEQS